MRYILPPNTHAVSARGVSFHADENGEVDLADQPFEIVHELVTYAGCKPVSDQHPPIPAPPQPTPAAPAASVEDVAASLVKAAAAVAEVAAAVAEVKEAAAEVRLEQADKTELRLPGGPVKPPRRAKAT